MKRAWAMKRAGASDADRSEAVSNKMAASYKIYKKLEDLFSQDLTADQSVLDEGETFSGSFISENENFLCTNVNALKLVLNRLTETDREIKLRRGRTGSCCHR